MTFAGATHGSAAEALSPTQVAQAEALVKGAVCLRCHGMVHRQVGPGFAQIAARYQGDAAAPVRLAAKIREGGVGTWGRLVMPRQHVTEAESLLLARWVLWQPPRP